MANNKTKIETWKQESSSAWVISHADEQMGSAANENEVRRRNGMTRTMGYPVFIEETNTRRMQKDKQQETTNNRRLSCVRERDGNQYGPSL